MKEHLQALLSTRRQSSLFRTGEGLRDTSHPVGCEVLVEGAPPIKADIIFVHGLRGHRRDTWTKDDICWPEKLLSKEESLSHTRILTFGYDANVISFTGRASMNSLFEHSISLLNELSRERKQDAWNRPIVFVAHSLGGLIVKDALDYSDRHKGTKPHLGRIFTATRGVIFLGTPHRGSSMASLAKVVASVARVALRNPNENLIRDLERDSQTLDRIRDNFSQLLDRHTFTVWSFIEALNMKGIGQKVVYGDSAVIGDAHEDRDYIHDDHVGMAKFSTIDSGYKKVLHAIEMSLTGIPEGKIALTEQGKPDTIAWKEVGPAKLKYDIIAFSYSKLLFYHIKTFHDNPLLQVPHCSAQKSSLECLKKLFQHSTNCTQQHKQIMYKNPMSKAMEFQNEIDSFFKVCSTFGEFYYKHGHFTDAERMYVQVLAGKEKALGAEHPSTLKTVNNLGLLYFKQGHLNDAEKMYECALAGKEKALGADHTSTLDTVSKLGILYRHQGRLNDAEKMYDHALAGMEQTLGPEHTSTLETVYNIGLLYANQGRLNDAAKMYDR